MSETDKKLVLTLSCPDQPGIVHAVSGLVGEAGGNILQSAQFGDPDTGLFFMRVSMDVPAVEPVKTRVEALADDFKMNWNLDEIGRPLRTVIMVSKEGHCLSDLLYRVRDNALPIDVKAVVGNHPDLAPIATFYQVPFILVPVTKDNKPEAEQRLLDLVEAEKVELVVLARYMQILSDKLCGRMSGRIINIHHSFLPSFKGAKPYAQAHDRGVKLIGATAHYVTADLDEGPIIEQDVARVDHTLTVAAMQKQGQDVERRVLAQAVKWHAEHRVLMDGNRTVIFH
ncbi:MAG: formyltetrahydrofolate deformylase [Mobiluncus porci]|uniref:Formyltetrahydrofolate deformylase n=1 Tax=Mobiluncus porci TaxID=2652278 RepID=A0A7K0K5G8_9ACTO|nr:formyltetrahydrofolate deformylase [Mobiluncus porci]MDD7540859.1 formyltetrahydrofolate deformylase [Mobiluncus porci]MDY5749223.1 formyltetrahydrofolate deformylase [Mobiluncus porci]MST50698.1 formyltetrahydrofolate deformylase [Mobiluncus porci]